MIVQLRNISCSFVQGRKILDNLDFDLKQGDKVGLVGHNGSGKTTLFRLLMGLLPFESGEMELFGRRVNRNGDFHALRPRIGFLFQDADDQLFCPTVLEDVAFGPLNLGMSSAEAENRANEVLDELGILSLADRVTYKLSGGEKKLVSLATVLAMRPELLLLDEPTNGLDEETCARLVALLENLELSMIVISHDFDFLSQVTRFAYFLRDGKLYADEGEALHSHYHVHRFGHYPHEHSHEG